MVVMFSFEMNRLSSWVVILTVLKNRDRPPLKEKLVVVFPHLRSRLKSGNYRGEALASFGEKTFKCCEFLASGMNNFVG